MRMSRTPGADVSEAVKSLLSRGSSSIEAFSTRVSDTVKSLSSRAYQRGGLLFSAAISGVTHRRGAAVSAAAILLAIVLLMAVVVGMPGRRDRGPRTTRADTVETRGSNGAPAGYQLPVVPNLVVLSLTAGLIGVVFAVSAVVSRRRAPDGAATVPTSSRRRLRIAHGAPVAAAFCLGLAFAAVVVVAVERNAIQAPSAVAPRQPANAGRGEASALKEVLHAEDGQAATALASPALHEPDPRPSTADVLRPPRVATASLGNRVWKDIIGDWETVRRTMRDLFPRD